MEKSIRAKTGVVDEDINRESPGFNLRRQSNGCRRLAEISRKHSAGSSVNLQFFGKGLHRLYAAGGEDEVMTVACQFTGKIGADSSGGAGHESKWAVCRA